MCWKRERDDEAERERSEMGDDGEGCRVSGYRVLGLDSVATDSEEEEEDEMKTEEGKGVLLNRFSELG